MIAEYLPSRRYTGVFQIAATLWSRLCNLLGHRGGAKSRDACKQIMQSLTTKIFMAAGRASNTHLKIALTTLCNRFSNLFMLIISILQKRQYIFYNMFSNIMVSALWGRSAILK